MYTVDEFASELKARYPQYSQMSNEDLVQKAIVKKPSLRDSISFDTPKKYTVSEFASELKAKYPKYAEMNDEDLVQKAIAKKPELKNSIEFEKPSLIDRGKEFIGKGVSAAGEIISSIVKPEQQNKGNIDLSNRPVVKNADGSISTVRSISFNEDGKEILIPTVSESGKIMDDDEAINEYHKTGKYLGKFNSIAEANKYAEQLHNEQEKQYSSISSGVTRSFEKPLPQTIENVQPTTFSPPAEQTATITDPLLEEKYRAVAESEGPVKAGLKEAGLALTYGESPVSKYRREEHPIATTVGTIAGTVAPMLVGGTGAVKTLTAVPKVAAIANSGKAGSMAVNGVARMTAATVDYLARNNEQLFSDNEEDRKEGKKNLTINLASAAASVLPEGMLAKGIIQPFAQAATDLVVEVIGQASFGDNAFNKENLPNTISTVIASGLFGLADVKGVSTDEKAIINNIKKMGDIELSKESSDRVDKFVAKALEEAQTPSQSKLIQPENPEFKTEMLPSGMEVTRNVRQPPIEADLKMTVDKGGEEPYISTKEIGNEQTIKPQPEPGISSRVPEPGIEAIRNDAEQRPGDTQTGERDRGEDTWVYGESKPEIEAALSETSPETLASGITKNISEEIDRLNFKSESMKEIDAQMEGKLQNVREAEKMAGQRGSIYFPGERKAEISIGGEQKVSETLEAGRFSSLNPVQKMKASVSSMLNSMRQSFTRYEADVEKFPQYKDNKRTQFAPMRRNLFDTMNKYRQASLSNLYSKEGKKGIRKVTDILLLRNLKLRGEKGQLLENGLTVDEVTKHLDWLEKNASPEVMQSVEDTKTILNGLGQELVERGKLSAESLEEDYFPHKVLDYLPDFMKGLKIPMSRKFGEPYRPYTKKALGSKRLIASDDSVIWTHVAKVLADNAQEDWLTKQAVTYDATSKVTPEERAKFYKGYETVIDGKRYKVLDWKKTRYKAKAVNESAMADALRSDMLMKDWLQTKTARGGKPIRDVMVSGKPQMYLLPKEIAVDLDNLIQKSPPFMDLVHQFGSLTQKWKGFTLGSAALPYQFGNIIGDNAMTALYDPAAFGYMPMATKVARKIFYPNSKIKLNEAEQKLYDVAQSKDVASSGMTSELRYSMYNKILDNYKTASEFRESLARLSILAHQLDRVGKGEQVQNLAGINLEGLDPESAAGKVAREVLVDYAAVPRTYQLFLSRGLLPFVRFHEGTFRNLARATTRNVGTHKAYKTIAPIAGAYAAQWAYNNLQEDKKELEMQLPDYIRNRWHIILGKTKEGNIVVWAAQQPIDMAMSWLGLDNINRIFSDLKDGRINPRQAAGGFVKSFKSGAPENIESLLNPIAQMWIGLKTNKDPFTKRKIMPDSIHKQGVFSKFGAKYSLGYMGEKIFSPIMQYNKAKRGTEPDQHPLYDWILKGPLNLKRALGFYEINPTTQDISEHFKTAEPLSAANEYYRSKFYGIIDTYGNDLPDGLKARKNNEPLTAGQQKAIVAVEKLSMSAKDNGFSTLDYGAWFKSMTAQRKIIDAELRKTKDEGKRKELLDRKKELYKASQVQYMKQIPKTSRKTYIEEMQKHNALPK